jgi:YfiH family protein
MLVKDDNAHDPETSARIYHLCCRHVGKWAEATSLRSFRIEMMPFRRPTDPAKPVIEIVRADGFAKLDWLVHGFSTRRAGTEDFTLGGATNDGERAARNRELFLEALDAKTGGKFWPLVTLKQVHSDVIHYVDRPSESQLIGDGLLTDAAELALAVQTADCLPVLVADPIRKAVGVFHAGWRGTLARIVEKGVGEMRRRFRSHPGDLRAAIGPGIHSCCYEVGGELREKFETQFSYASALFHDVFASDPVRERYPLLFMSARAPGHSHLGPKLHLDLVEANRRQLLEAGLSSENIWASELCTSCRTDLLFSYRAEGAKTGRLMGAIAIRG